MPWKVESMQSQKQKFILLYETGRFTKAELCRQFSISRPTGDAILKRYREEGWEALGERSRRHGRHPAQTAEVVEDAIVAERDHHPRWGARKIRELLFRNPAIEDRLIPSETTVNAILKRHGLVVARRKGRVHCEARHPTFDPTEPNEIWSTDFKGKFRMGNRQYCSPLTIADSASRFLFAIEGLARADTEHCKPVFERVFREWGMPEYMHSDNGPPFANPASLRRVTQLAVWFMELGITPVYSDPGHPEQNGRHERMHRELKAEATRPPGADFRGQQRKFDRFRLEYNNERPHEALSMRRPAEVHVRSPREYPRMIRDWDYPKDTVAKLVTVNGAIRWNMRHLVMISTALTGKYIGLKEVDSGFWDVYYREIHLGVFSERTMKVYEVEDYWGSGELSLRVGTEKDTVKDDPL